MEENKPVFTKPSAGKAALTYGLILGAVLIVLHLILFLLNIHKGTTGFIITLAVIIAGITMATLDYRNKKWNGFITYGKVVKIGFVTMLFAAIIVAVYTFIYHGYINPADMRDARIEATQQIYNMGLDPEAESQALKMQEFIHTPLVYSLATIFSYALMGIIISLVVAIFIKKEESPSLS
ncbi:MAG: DUF4199 domain-containing protein [Bacteroidales bacterium]|nr:DUF4199 domain-containing protein [Bacteroidales bacterium]